MNAFKSMTLEILLIIICMCTVSVYKVPACMMEWLMNTLACIVLGIAIVRMGVKYLNH